MCTFPDCRHYTELTHRSHTWFQLSLEHPLLQAGKITLETPLPDGCRHLGITSSQCSSSYRAGKFVTKRAAPSVMDNTVPREDSHFSAWHCNLDKAAVYFALNLLAFGGLLLYTTYTRFGKCCFCSFVFNRFLQQRTWFLWWLLRLCLQW